MNWDKVDEAIQGGADDNWCKLLELLENSIKVKCNIAQDKNRDRLHQSRLDDLIVDVRGRLFERLVEIGFLSCTDAEHRKARLLFFITKSVKESVVKPVSYTHLTLPTKRIV